MRSLVRRDALRALAQGDTARALAAFALAALALTGPALWGNATLSPDTALDADPLYWNGAGSPPPAPRFGDPTPTVVDWPRDRAVARGLHAGRLDAWNPLVGCGAPLWAEQGGPFFPLKLPFYLVPGRHAYDLFLVLRLLFAALGAYLLATRRRLAPLAATAAGLLFETSGACVSQLAFAAASPLFVLPWVLLGAEALADGSAAAVAGSGLALGIAGLGGHPALVLLVFAAFTVATATRAASLAVRSPRDGLRLLARGTASGLLGLAISAPSLLPLAELAHVGRSYKETAAGEALWRGYLHADQRTLPMALFAPRLLAALRGPLAPLFPRAFAPTIGILGLALALAGISAGALDAPLAAVAILGLGLAAAPPGLAWLHRVPLLGLVQPCYGWALVALPIALAAGGGVQASAGERGPPKLIVALLVTSAAAPLLFLVRNDPRSGVAYGALLHAVVRAPWGAWRLLVPFAIAALAVAGSVALRRTRFASRAPALLVAAATAQLILLFAPLAIHPASRSASSGPSPAVRFLERALADGGGRMLAIPAQVGAPDTPSLFDLPDLREISALPVSRYAGYLAAIDPAIAARYPTQQAVDVAVSPLVDAAAVRYIVLAHGGATAPPVLAGDSLLPLAYADEHVAIYENLASLPRARIVHQAFRVGDAPAALSLLRRLARSAAHAHDVALDVRAIVGPSEDGSPPPALDDAAPATGEAARVVPDGDPDRLAVDAQLDRPGLLVLADTYYPGWQASVDGAPTPIFPADLLFRSIAVAAGRHHVVFSYRPPLLRAGIGLALAALLGCALLWRRRTRPA